MRQSSWLAFPLASFAFSQSGGMRQSSWLAFSLASFAFSPFSGMRQSSWLAFSLTSFASVLRRSLRCQPVRGVNTREECHRAHACKSFKQAGVETDGQTRELTNPSANAHHASPQPDGANPNTAESMVRRRAPCTIDRSGSGSSSRNWILPCLDRIHGGNGKEQVDAHSPERHAMPLTAFNH
jgi:hypothetical protein